MPFSQTQRQTALGCLTVGINLWVLWGGKEKVGLRAMALYCPHYSITAVRIDSLVPWVLWPDTGSVFVTGLYKILDDLLDLIITLPTDTRFQNSLQLGFQHSGEVGAEFDGWGH